MMREYNKFRWEDAQKRNKEFSEIQDWLFGDTDMPESLKEIIPLDNQEENKMRPID